jgi:ribose 5-phosphate isomerase A
MTQDESKALAAAAAVPYVQPGSIIGVGTGSTVGYFITELARMKERIAGAVSSSERSTALLRGHGIPILDANDVEALQLYVDGADEIDGRGYMIKGGGAALTREKIIADLAQRFVCIADESKRVERLGAFPLPIEVIPMAARQIGRHVERLGGRAVLRAGVVTDNGGHILDVHGLHISDPPAMEREIDQWPGVVTVGVFARNKANVCILGGPQGTRTLTF